LQQQREAPSSLKEQLRAVPEEKLLPRPEHLTPEAQVQEHPREPVDDNSLIIQTKKGRVRGATLTATTGKKVDAWFGIPYAQKPLGEQYLLFDIHLIVSALLPL
jgi:hypothetical protein